MGTRMTWSSFHLSICSVWRYRLQTFLFFFFFQYWSYCCRLGFLMLFSGLIDCYFEFMQFSQQLALLNGEFLEMGLQDRICEIEFTELLIVIDLFFGGLLLLGTIIGASLVFFFKVVLFDLMELPELFGLFFDGIHWFDFNFWTI